MSDADFTCQACDAPAVAYTPDGTPCCQECLPEEERQAIRDRARRRQGWTKRERHLLARLQAGDTVVVRTPKKEDPGPHPHLYDHAEQAGLLVRIDRNTGSKWRNPEKMRNTSDEERERVIRWYVEEHLPAHPDLLAQVHTLRGQALACWCAPEVCHGHVLQALADGHTLEEVRRQWGAP